MEGRGKRKVKEKRPVGVFKRPTDLTEEGKGIYKVL